MLRALPLVQHRLIPPLLPRPFARSLAHRSFTTTSHSKDDKGAMPEEADVVVIGGGSIGSSTAYHLASRGVSVVLLERNQMTSGTTWHSAGMVWRLRPSDVDVELHAYGRDKCLELEKTTGVASWTQNGGLFIACNEERLSEYKRLSTMGKFFGIESYVLAPHEITDVHPLVSPVDVHGAIYSPSDGTIDPSGIVLAYTRGAQSLGAKIFENTTVDSILTDGPIKGQFGRKRITGVKTSSGHVIKTSAVVNACGAWAAKLSESIGAPIPLRAMRHAYVVTEGLPGMHGGLPNVRDHDLSIYLKTQGNAMAAGGYEQNPEFWAPDDNTPFNLFDLNWDTFEQNLQGHLKRCPAIREAGIKSTVCGPESFTPDHKPLVGAHNDITGYYLACGMNSMGIMLAGGLGRELANIVVDGHSSVDLFAFDPSRFHPSTLTNQTWIEDRTHESYAKTYSIIFPHDEPLAGRNARVSALHSVLQQDGCMFQQRHGYERPGWFVRDKGSDASVKDYDYYGAYGENGGLVGGLNRSTIPKHAMHTYHRLLEGECTFGWPASHAIVAAEVKAARSGVVLFDQSYFGKFYVSGKEASAAMEWLCTGRVSEKPVGAVTYTTFCNENGGVEADLTVTRLDTDVYYIAAGGNTLTHDKRWIHAVFEKKGFKEVEIRDASDEETMLSVQGPYSRTLLARLAQNPEDLENSNFPFSHCRQLQIAGVLVKCLRLTFIGELGFELHFPREHALHIYQSLRHHGRILEQERGIPVVNSGYRAIDSMSAEKGYRHWHADLTCGDTPFEASIGFVALSKLRDSQTPFVGRSVLETQLKQGVSRKLVCLVLEDSNVPLHGREAIYRNGVCVGYVKSTAFGHTIGKTIAYGYVEAAKAGLNGKITNAWLQEGKYQIEDRLVRHDAQLHLKAPFDPENRRIAGDYFL